MKSRSAVCCAVLCFCFTTVVFAQDPVKVDPAHYTVEMENAQVRILRVHYGAHEKSVMHSHPDSVAVFLSDGTIKFTLADGKTQNASGTKGQVLYEQAQIHNPENTGDAPFDVIVIELKGGAK
jgi:quercetin dioxygenase-like cupin family protein